MIFLNQIIQGVLLGGYYALIACGLSFMFGIMGVINLAHGSLAVLAGYALYVLADRFGVERPCTCSAGRAREEEILFHREPGEQAAAFGNKPHAQRGARMRGFRAEILALEGDPAGRHSVCAGDGAQKGGLAGAVRADEGDRLGLLDAEADAAHSLKLAVAGFKPFD